VQITAKVWNKLAVVILEDERLVFDNAPTYANVAFFYGLDCLRNSRFCPPIMHKFSIRFIRRNQGL
jgi:hypothetical protein